MGVSMDFKTMDKVGQFLEQATPEQITQIAQDMADKAPHLMPLAMTAEEKAEAYIKINIASVSDDLTASYAKGLIDCAYLVGLIDEAKSEHYKGQLDKGSK